MIDLFVNFLCNLLSAAQTGLEMEHFCRKFDYQNLQLAAIKGIFTILKQSFF